MSEVDGTVELVHGAFAHTVHSLEGFSATLSTSTLQPPCRGLGANMDEDGEGEGYR